MSDAAIGGLVLDFVAKNGVPQTLEGDVVDSDTEFSELCARMREAGRSSCTIVFCESDVFVEAEAGTGVVGAADASRRTA